MIADLWDSIVQRMKTIGWMIDKNEADSLMDWRFSIRLPQVRRDDLARTFSRISVERDVRVRLQFRDRKDAAFEKSIAQEVEKVAVALRPILLFEASTTQERGGGMVAEVQFSALDSLS